MPSTRTRLFACLAAALALAGSMAPPPAMAQAATAATAATAFFISAHEDDWQLFMGHQAYSDLHHGGARTVLVHVTAGDAGQGVSTRYFLARKEGALRALRFIKGTASRGRRT